MAQPRYLGVPRLEILVIVFDRHVRKGRVILLRLISYWLTGATS